MSVTFTRENLRTDFSECHRCRDEYALCNLRTVLYRNGSGSLANVCPGCAEHIANRTTDGKLSVYDTLTGIEDSMDDMLPTVFSWSEGLKTIRAFCLGSLVLACIFAGVSGWFAFFAFLSGGI